MIITNTQIQAGNLLAGLVANALGEHLTSTEPYAAGSTSAVFRLKTDRSDYILRLATPRPGKSASYQSDFAIRRSLWESGQPVAKPIATDRSLDVGTDERWALDEFCAGGHPQRAAIPPDVSRRLGRLLKSLHSFPASGYGQLKDTDTELAGGCDNPIDVMLTRLESPWPFTSVPLRDHPAVLDNPTLLDPLSSMQPRLSEFLADRNGVVVHSDLHERQLLTDGTTLAAVLDFNDAVVGRLEWDFGSYLYFHGPGCLSDLLDGYTDDVSQKSRFADNALLAGILIALHHGNRGVLLGIPDRIQASAKFLKGWLGAS